MTDIIERLRDIARMQVGGPRDLSLEAADIIEKHRAAIEPSDENVAKVMQLVQLYQGDTGEWEAEACEIARSILSSISRDVGE